MNPLLLNRDFQMPDDGWFHIVPSGEFPHPSGVVQIIDRESADAIVDDFKNRAAHPNWPGLLVDFDHFSTDTDAPSQAAGWIDALENRDGNVYAHIRWSDLGETSVRGGRYRLVSPVFARSPIDDLGNKRIRVKRLLSVALTNDPNLRGMRPLSNRRDSSEPAETPNPKDTMKNIMTALGISADSNEETAVAKIAEIKNRNTQLEADNKTLLETQIETDLAKYANRVIPEFKDKLRAQLLNNRAAAIELLEAMPVITAAPPTGQAPILNRASGTPPANTPADTSVAARHAVEDYRLRNRCSWDQAWDAVRRDKPELFK